ncbi:MAG: TetR/AcrR family transcriptional regulator [Chitinophagaceae bacterium]|nr:MAG: TetR/AcrR family transcriptional regulator [Chitinophagaceae bacterium]
MAPRKKEDFKEMQEISRKKILMAAFELFAIHGYTRTSVDSIAAKAKISKGLIYHYFSSKQDILKNLFGLLLKETAVMMQWSESLSPEEYMQRMIDFSVNYIVQKPKINRLMMALVLQPEVMKGLKKDFDKMRIVWMSALTDLFKKLKMEDPEGEAYLFGAIFDGMSVGYLTLGEEYPVKNMKKLIEKRYGL